LLGLPVDRLGELGSVIAGSVIFLTITELPDSDATTSLALNFLLAKRRRTASATRRHR
jgi:hypothetical protein